ncbi:transglutaminase domain-containing protein [Gorillibacterium massiliense]|uniref:transglutaminase domain-containing protein n=1 Tax=Gorillibacterium massiliense TaxID=1280390 RepID=UPI0004AE7B49|nr:transglutaminase-like domain-containing protein [Gorillibacterium massiliense]
MADLLEAAKDVNAISALLVIILAASILQGAGKGASGSALQFIRAVIEGVFTLAAILMAWLAAKACSPLLQSWLVSRNIKIPAVELDVFSRGYYTFVTGLRDFTLLRTGLLFLLAYMIVKMILNAVTVRITSIRTYEKVGNQSGSPARRWLSSITGAFVGGLTGMGRALAMIALLFVCATVFPNSPIAGYIQSSSLYQKGANEIIEPVTGKWVTDRLPVFSRQVQEEFAGILQRRYEVLDANIPDNIAAAALEVTKGDSTPEEKARSLYSFIGTRVQYDWDKYNLYMKQRIWKEQTPEETFASKKGVCIDYSRLYAVMAKAVGLDVRVVTGLGYDGQGGYGPHAWNEVKVDGDHWIPLDSTWVSSGGNWFNPPGFEKTHIKESA